MNNIDLTAVRSVERSNRQCTSCRKIKQAMKALQQGQTSKERSVARSNRQSKFCRKIKQAMCVLQKDQTEVLQKDQTGNLGPVERSDKQAIYVYEKALYFTDPEQQHDV